MWIDAGIRIYGDGRDIRVERADCQEERVNGIPVCQVHFKIGIVFQGEGKADILIPCNEVHGGKIGIKLVVQLQGFLVQGFLNCGFLALDQEGAHPGIGEYPQQRDGNQADDHADADDFFLKFQITELLFYY